MSQTAETLRAIIKDGGPASGCNCYKCRDQYAACDAGARAWEILSDIDFAVKADDHEALANLYLVVRDLLDAEGR